MPATYFGTGEAKERFRFWLNNPPSAISIDVETVSLDDRTPLGFAVGFSPYESIYFDISGELPRELELLIPILKDMRILKIGHNLMFDLGVFPLIPVVGHVLERSNIFDTNVAARLLGKIEAALYMVGAEINMYTRPISEILKENSCKNNRQLIVKDPMILAEHCALDAKVAYSLYLDYKDKIQSQYGAYFNVEMEALPIVLDISLHGLKIDQAKRAELAAQYQKDIDFYSSHIQSFGISKPTSPAQIGYTLAERGSFLKFTKSRKQYSTRESELQFLSDPLAASVLNFREKFKFKSTYLDPLEGQDRYFTEYYFDTSVGRMSSRRRDIQNIPLPARAMFLPDSGTFTTGDYSREHLYILAHMSQDREMLKVLYDEDKKKSDLHQHTADKMGVPRSLAKTLNFAVAYGATAQTVRDHAKIRDLSRCQRLIDDWFKAYRGVADWVVEAQRIGRKDGWALPTVFGRRIRIPEEDTDDSRDRKAVNYPILGSDGEVIKRAIILCTKRGLGPPPVATPMVITVHDSITWDGAVEDRLPVRELEAIPGFRVPFEVKQTARWE